ncbi:MAG: hypothetical protein J0L64_26815, partial [Acidobacteria bacterium]|nr:hypothetical protein [Acidobacteriota bacterium]
ALVATARIAGLANESGPVTVTVNDLPVQSASYAGGLLTFTVPSGTPFGPATLRVKVNGEELPVVAMSVDLPPPSIAAVYSGGTKIDVNRPARPGEVITLMVTGAGDLGADVSAGRVRVLINGQPRQALQVGLNNDGSYSVQVQLDQGMAAGTHMLTVAFDSRVSPVQSLPVR